MILLSTLSFCSSSIPVLPSNGHFETDSGHIRDKEDTLQQQVKDQEAKIQVLEGQLDKMVNCINLHIPSGISTSEEKAITFHYSRK